ncbi:MAG: carboxypeptidase-like regulatory domain-containing protein [Acidobacteriota bacterium]
MECRDGAPTTIRTSVTGVTVSGVTVSGVIVILLALLLHSSPALGGGPGCALETPQDNGEGRLSQVTRDIWTWQSKPGDRVRCDIEAHEPLDADCRAETCAGDERELRLFRGRAVELTGPHPQGPVDIAWRRFGAAGEASESLAQRRLTPPAASQPWTLFTAAEEDRLLRLQRTGGAPETFFIPAVSEDNADTPSSPWPISPRWPSVGGEIFGFVDSEDFQPATLVLEGAGAKRELTPGVWSQFSAPGLPPGQYRLRAIFEGGWRLDGPPILVEGGETTELLPWELPRNGAIELALEPELCAETTEARSLAFAHREQRGKAHLTLDAGTCIQRFEGLPPGEWMISLDDPKPHLPSATPTAMRRMRPSSTASLTARVTVRVEAGAVSEATLERPRIILEGRVTASGQGLPDLELRLTRLPSPDAAPAPDDATLAVGSAPTDGEGVYRLEAPTPGPAVLWLTSQDGYPVVSRDVDLTVGNNRHDFDLGDGRIRVFISSVEGEPEGPVTVEVWNPSNKRLVRTGRLEPDREETLVYGLDFGQYELSAFTEEGLATPERPRVELTKSQPADDVELVLEEQSAVATVRDANGFPVSGLLVAIDQRQLAETGEQPGEYSLLGASAGSELRVVPPLNYLPVCRMLERIEPVEITLRPANAHALLIPPAGPLPPAGSFLGALENLPGSNCPMPVSLLWQPVEDSTGRQLVRLDGLTQGTFMFRNINGVVIIQVPGPPVPMPGVE